MHDLNYSSAIAAISIRERATGGENAILSGKPRPADPDPLQPIFPSQPFRCGHLPLPAD
jgi:hypothetical protein